MNKQLLFPAFVFFGLAGYSQNVGVGTTTPNRARFEVHGAAGAGKTSGLFGGDGAGISLQKDWPTIGFNQYRDNAAGFGKYMTNGYAALQHFEPATGLLNFDFYPNGTADNAASSSTRAMTMTSQGRIGIGGAAPNSELQLPNTISNRKITLWEASNNPYQYFGFGIESGTLTYNIRGVGDMHRFYCGNTASSSNTLMTISGNKKVVIGTQDGGSKLGINSADPQYALELVQADHTGLVIIDPNTWNHWELKTEQVGSNGNYLFFRYNASGTSFIHPDGSYHETSDSRLKYDVESLPKALPKLLQLKPVTYFKRTGNADYKNIGFIAQELQQYFPELVSVVDGAMAGYKDIPDLHTVNYSQLSVIAIKAIQEQQAIIDKQQQQIQELLQDVKYLKEKLGNLSTPTKN